MTTFASRMHELSAKGLEDIQRRREQLRARQLQREDQMMYEITQVFHPLVVNCIERRARGGYTTAFMNFNRAETGDMRLFRADCPGLGFPHDVLVRWLNNMSTPENKYLKCSYDANTNDSKDTTRVDYRDHFQGISCEFLKNKKYTVCFSWSK